MLQPRTPIGAVTTTLRKAWSRLPDSFLTLLIGIWSTAAISVELTEVLGVTESTATGVFTFKRRYEIEEYFGGIDPIDNDCAGSKCLGIFTRDGSLELGSKYGCTLPDQPLDEFPENCGVTYNIGGTTGDATITSVHIAFHPDSSRAVRVLLDDTIVVNEWEGGGGENMQAIPGVEGAVGSELTIEGVLVTGEYLGILEVEIYVEVDEVEVTGVSASSRIDIASSATTDEASAVHTLDGDASDEFAWTCFSGEVCEVTYDFGDVESLEQVRIAFSDNTDVGGEFDVYAAGEAGVFSMASAGIEAGGRPTGSDGLQTFGGVRALARYIKIKATPATGGIIGITKVEFQVHEDAPIRAVTEKPWLKDTGPLPAGRMDTMNYAFAYYDARSRNEGGCDPPGLFSGCHIFYIKDGNMSVDSRWTCGPTALGDLDVATRLPYGDGPLCAVEFDLNIYRYVRQIQLAFHLSSQQNYEFAIQAYTKNYEWATVVSSAISSGNTSSLQTFDVSVHTDVLRIVPKFHSVDEMFSINEMVILEKRKKAFVEGTVPVFHMDHNFDGDGITEATTHYKFDIPDVGDEYQVMFAKATVSGLRMKFPKGRSFTFDVVYYHNGEDISQRFTSAGEGKTWETFTLSMPAVISFDIVAVEGPTFEHKPWYPTLRVVDFQILGEVVKEMGTFQMVSTAITTWGFYNGDGGWGRVPDLIAEASADQEVIMTAICETKGAAFDGIDCVGELDDTPVRINLAAVPNDSGYFMNGPIFLKSGVTLEGDWNAEFGDWSDMWVYDGPHITRTGEDAVVVIDGATDVSLEWISFSGWWGGVTGPIEPGTVGNLCLEIRNSKDVLLEGELMFRSARAGAARFTDSTNITAWAFWVGDYETGNFLELTRVEDFYISAPPRMSGLLVDTCTTILFEGAYDTFEIPSPGLYPPTGGEQTSNVVITGDSSSVVFKNMPVGPGIEPRILMESTEPLTLDDIPEYEEAETGDCIVQVPEESTEDILVQLNSEEILTVSGNCWVL